MRYDIFYPNFVIAYLTVVVIIVVVCAAALSLLSNTLTRIQEYLNLSFAFSSFANESFHSSGDAYSQMLIKIVTIPYMVPQSLSLYLSSGARTGMNISHITKLRSYIHMLIEK